MAFLSNVGYPLLTLFSILGRDIYYEFIINPPVAMAIHKASQVHLAAIIRIHYIIVSIRNAKTY